MLSHIDSKSSENHVNEKPQDVTADSRTKKYAQGVFQQLATSLDEDLWNYLKEKITYTSEDPLASLNYLDTYLEEHHIEGCCPNAITRIFAALFEWNNPHAPANVKKVVVSQYCKGMTLHDIMHLQIRSWSSDKKPHRS